MQSLTLRASAKVRSKKKAKSSRQRPKSAGGCTLPRRRSELHLQFSPLLKHRQLLLPLRLTAPGRLIIKAEYNDTRADTRGHGLGSVEMGATEPSLDAVTSVVKHFLENVMILRDSAWVQGLL